MIVVPVDLQNHCKGEATTLAYCWTLRRKDGQVLGFTDHDMPLVLNGVTHEPDSGLNPSAAESELGLSVSTMDVEGALRSDTIDAGEVRRGLYDGATVETSLINWNDLAQRVLLRKAIIGRIEMTDGAFKAELKGLAAAADKRAGRLVTRRCDAELGDARCGVNSTLAANFANATVIAVERGDTFLASGINGKPVRWAEHGRLKWLTGGNAGSVSRVVLHDSDGGQARFSLAQTPVAAIAISDTFQVTTGCDKSFRTCKAKFANTANFRGFPHMPGEEAIYTYVSGEGIYDGAPLVP